MQRVEVASKHRSYALFFLAGVLSLVLGFKLACAIAGYPPTWVDEYVYVEPSVNFVNEGVFASPGLARQMEMKGLGGLDRHSFFNVPLAAYARVPIYELFGTAQTGRRIADWVFLVLAAGALYFALRQWCSCEISTFCSIIFILHKVVSNDDRGRPDLLSLTFGLLAFVILSKELQRGDNLVTTRRQAWTALLMGFLIGLGGLSHQFGGVFWAVVIVIVKTTQDDRNLGWFKWAQWMLLFCLGGLAGISLWIPQIYSAPHIWAQQFFFMLNLKQHLLKGFHGSVVELVQDTIFRNPFVFIVLIAGLAVKRKNLAPGNIRMALILCLAILAIWRCLSFEPYLQAYSIHFWAAICLLLGLLTGDLISFVNARFTGARRLWIKNAIFGVVMLAGLNSLYTPLTEVFMMPSAKMRTDVIHLLQANISRPERVLADPAYYFEVPSTNKLAWMWTEKLDLKKIDALVAAYPSKQSVPAFPTRDQWINCLTLEQSNVFMENYELEASLPPPAMTNSSFLGDLDGGLNALTKKLGMANHHGPQLNGCYIYRNKHPIPN